RGSACRRQACPKQLPNSSDPPPREHAPESGTSRSRRLPGPDRSGSLRTPRSESWTKPNGSRSREGGLVCVSELSLLPGQPSEFGKQSGLHLTSHLLPQRRREGPVTDLGEQSPHGVFRCD